MEKVSNFTLKLGNSITGNPEMLFKIRGYVQSHDCKIRAVVVSAPGRGKYFSTKVTDLLEGIYDTKDVAVREGLVQDLLKGFRNLAIDLGIYIDDKLSVEMFTQLCHVHTNRDYILSRGEYMTAEILGNFFGLQVVQPVQHIFIDTLGNFTGDVGNTFPEFPFIMPGFYGRAIESHDVRIFPRGGSDISAAFVAVATGTTLWRLTSTPLCYVDPAIVIKARYITCLHYSDLLIMAELNKDVLHPSAVVLCQKHKTHIRIGTLREVTEITDSVMPAFAGIHSPKDFYVPDEIKYAFPSNIRAVVVLGSGMVGKSGYVSRMSSVLSGITIHAIWSPPASGVVYFFVNEANRMSTIRLLYSELCHSD
ncbi:MAG: aspartate kinase [Candidatus Pacebacteria bacterium]|nr:aspartate kinase [Candidatus Paceibacterota bacterium]